MKNTTACAMTAALLISGCTNGHDRPHGHGNVTYSIAPSGKTLVFNAAGEGGRDLYMLDLGTDVVTRIAATPEYEVDPEFAPDGKSIVYAAGIPGDRADHIFARSTAGATAKQLTRGDANDSAPAFSGDGSRIVFTRDKTYNWGGAASNWDAGGVICVMEADGSGLRQITPDGSMAVDPHFSTDGRAILFWDERGLASVASDGSESPKRLGHPESRQACYSPDGRSIAFSAGRYSPDQTIYMAGSDGKGQSQVTAFVGKDREFPGGGCSHPAFTPDGRRLFFFLESWPNGPTGEPKQALWSIGLDGQNPRQVADPGLFDDPTGWKMK